MRKMKLFFTALAVMMTSVAFAQNITVTGSVTDSSTDEPVPFAAVHLSGTMQGVAQTQRVTIPLKCLLTKFWSFHP